MRQEEGQRNILSAHAEALAISSLGGEWLAKIVVCATEESRPAEAA